MKKISLLTVVFALTPIYSFSSTHRLKPIQVSGKAKFTSQIHSTPAEIAKEGSDIQEDGINSVGDAVKDLPGVNSSGFSAASTRPVIRGLEGERSKVLIDEMSTLDVSSTSADHAVPINPLLIDSLEVLRGPVTLLYGSSVSAGLINIVSSRQHEEKFEGYTGALSTQYESVNNLKNVTAKLDYGTQNWVFHVDGNHNHNQNLKVPTAEEKIENSQSEQSSQNIGASYFYGNDNHVHLSFTNYDSLYGVVVEDEVTIDLNQKRADFSTKNQLNSSISEVHTKTSFVDYEHTEFEGTEVGTVFDKTAVENRLDFVLSKDRGTFGLHTTYSDMEVIGDEAFLPSSKDFNSALYAYTAKQVSPKFNLKASGRIETATVNPENIESENYLLMNLSLAYEFKPSEASSFTTNLSYNERNPNAQELFSDGAHIAIGIYEVGDADLEVESSISGELSYSFVQKNKSFQINVFTNIFNNYINLANTGNIHDTDESGTAGDSDEDFEIYNYEQVSALFYGAEFLSKYQFTKSLNLESQFDILVGRNTDTNTYLPRITPPRLSFRLNNIFKGFQTHLEFTHAFEPINTALNETDTEAYSIVNIGASKTIRFKHHNLRLYGKLKNIFDEEARNHASLTKGVMQEGGFSALVGVEAAF